MEGRVEALVAYLRSDRFAKLMRSPRGWLIFFGVAILFDFLNSQVQRTGGLVTVLVFVIAAAAIVLVQRAVLRAQAAKYRGMASRLGLTYEALDRSRLTDLPFELIRSGGAATISHVLTGESGGIPVTVFVYERSTRLEVNGRQLPHAFLCAMTVLPVSAPQLVLERQGRDAYQLGPALGEAPVVRTESNDFDRAFVTRSDDPRFALTVLGPSMMGWLLTTPGTWNVEVYGGRLLVYLPGPEPRRIPALLATLSAVRQRLPDRVLPSLAPRTRDDPSVLRHGAVEHEPRPRSPRPLLGWIVFGVVLLVIAVAFGPHVLVMIAIATCRPPCALP